MTDKPCKDCGAPMLHLDPTTEVCSRLNDLMVRRFMVNDRRPVSHASLAEVPDVVTLDLGSVTVTHDNAPWVDAPSAAGFSIGLDITHLALTDRGPQLGGTVRVRCDHVNAYECAHCRERRCMDCDAPCATDSIKTAVRWCPTHREDGRMGRL